MNTTTTTAADMRDFLSGYFEGAAETRDRWADEHDDPDSLKSAKALRAASAFVQTLPTDDRRFQRLADAFANAGLKECDHDILGSFLSDPDQAAILRLAERTDPASQVLRLGYGDVSGDDKPLSFLDKARAEQFDDFLAIFVDHVECDLPVLAQEWRELAGEVE